MPLVYLSLGSNLGQRKKNIKKAIVFLRGDSRFQVIKISSFYETQPEGFKNQPKFINLCLKIRTDFSPGRLLKFLKDTEKRLGRKKGKRWGPRVIDIDILFYNKKVINRKGLIIPHPGLEERIFVLKPLAEISPAFHHPGLGLTIRELFRRQAVRENE